MVKKTWITCSNLETDSLMSRGKTENTCRKYKQMAIIGKISGKNKYSLNFTKVKGFKMKKKQLPMSSKFKKRLT